MIVQKIEINFQTKDASTMLVKSLQNLGFAILNNHSINPLLIEEVHTGWQAFFAASIDEKNQYQCNKKTLDGYFPFGIEKTSYGKTQDFKEFFYFYAWGICPENLREKTLLLHHELLDLGNKLLQIIDDSLPEKIKDRLSVPLRKMTTNTQRAVLRILHYPPIPTNKEGVSRAIEHEDLTLISIVNPIVGSGLQVKDHGGNWHCIPAGINRLVINIGDMLELCSKKFYQATTHRVLNPGGEEANYSRYSNAFFLNPNDEIVLDKEKTAGDLLQTHINKKLENYYDKFN